uniref:ECSIT signaling integrator n=1 Tax=Oryctolagus cuniculus TaxID=9986 RepID=A0A5F9CZX7_RABIT
MREFGVQRDLAVYNLLLDVFPKEVFRPRNVFQRMFVHYPRQQECGVAVLEQMEQHGVMPDTQTEFLLTQIFGRRSYPMLKLVRMKLWLTRFKNVNPFPVPLHLPPDPVDLAKLGLRHMEPDLSARVTVYQMSLPSDPASPEEPAQPHIVGKALTVPPGPAGLGSAGPWAEPLSQHQALLSPPQESRAPISRPPWPATTQPGPSSWRAPSPCGCGTSVSTTTSSGLTCCPPRRGTWRRCRRSGVSSTQCSWTWSTPGVPGTTLSLTSTKWRKAPSSPCA